MKVTPACASWMTSSTDRSSDGCTSGSAATAAGTAVQLSRATLPQAANEGKRALSMRARYGTLRALHMAEFFQSASLTQLASAVPSRAARLRETYARAGFYAQPSAARA